MNGHIDAFAVQEASRWASRLVATAGFRRDDRDDLRQEIILDLLRRTPRFDSARGDWHGFVRGVYRHRQIGLITQHRRRRWEVLAGDLGPAEDGNDDRLDALDCRRRTDPARVPQLRLDVRRVVAGLPPRLQSLALVLGELPIAEVCMRTGKSRATVHRMTVQIREAFVNAGLAPGRSVKFQAVDSRVIRIASERRVQ
jgi:RNA polymerase sigma-70 factor, ECF subfamily